MARKKRNSRQTGQKQSLSRTLKKDLPISQRDDSFISRPRLSSRSVGVKYDRLRFLADDDRFFRPDRRVKRHLKTNSRRSSVSSSFKLSLARLRFDDPRRERVCQKRHERREALFALGRVGSGRRVRKERRVSPESSISCK